MIAASRQWPAAREKHLDLLAKNLDGWRGCCPTFMIVERLPHLIYNSRRFYYKMNAAEQEIDDEEITG